MGWIPFLQESYDVFKTQCDTPCIFLLASMEI